MFCEKCGAKNDDMARFCEECGAAFENDKSCDKGESMFNSTRKSTFTAPKLSDTMLDTSFNGNSLPKTEKKPIGLKNKIILVVIGVLIISCGALYSFGKMATAPEKIVEKYFENISTQKYEEAYEYMDIESNEFTTKDMFVKVMENRNSEKESEILNYTINENAENNPLIKRYTITYTQKGDSNTSDMDVILMKRSSKKWLFYDDYKIAEDGLTAKDYSITVPDGTEIFIDDIKVNESYAEMSTEASPSMIKEKSYTIPSIFVGTHKVRVLAPFSKEKIFDKNIEEDGFIDVYSVEMTEDARKKVSEIAEEFLSKIVISAIEKKPFDEMKAYFSVNADIDDIQERYNALKEKGVNDEGVGVKSITFGQVASYAKKEYQSEERYDVSLDYEYEYTALKENFSDEAAEKETFKNSQTGSDTIYFVYEDGRWLVSDFYINIYLYY